MTTAVQLAQSVAPGVSLGFKNRIINGNMTIDQRNAGASTSFTVNQNTYTLDRWTIQRVSFGSFTVQQSSTAPAGFTYSLVATSTASDTSNTGSARCLISQHIEGYNTADLGWGTVNAKAVTLSFQVRSSLTGTFGGAIQNSAGDRSYPFTYTISSANTWTPVSIVVAGDTSGTWLTTNGVGITVRFGLGTGPDIAGTPGVWASADYRSATGAVNVLGTNGATFYITGVQLEVGTAATSFEFRDYGRELIMCQRYCYVVPANNVYMGALQSTTTTFLNVAFPVTMRAAPSATYSNSTYQLDDFYSSTVTGTSMDYSGYSNTSGRIWVKGHGSLTTPRPMETSPSGNTCVATISAEL